MKKQLLFRRYPLATAMVLVIAVPLLGQEANPATIAKDVNYVAEIRMLELPVQLDGDKSPKCEIIDEVLRTTDILDVEIQCPGQDTKVPDVDPANKAIPQNARVSGFETNNRHNSVVVVRLKNEAVHRLIQSTKAGTNSGIAQAPTVTMEPGQLALVLDGSHRPFVTGVKRIVGDFAEALQPTITSIPDGRQIEITARPDGEQIRVEASIEDRKILSVEELHFPGGKRDITMQFPNVQLESVRATGTVASGETLLLIPACATPVPQARKATPMSVGKRLFQAEPAQVPVRKVVMITVRAVEADGHRISAVSGEPVPPVPFQYSGTLNR